MSFPLGGALALDWGQKKVGFATADESGIVVTARGHFKRKVPKSLEWTLGPEDKREIQALLTAYEPGILVLGLPLNADGTESVASSQARLLAAELRKAFSMEVLLVSEVLSSWASKGAKDEDAEAAATLIRDYLHKSKMSDRRGYSSISVILTLIVAILGAGGFYLWNEFARKPALLSNETFILDVPPKSNFQSVNNSLTREGIFINPIFFKVWIRLRKADGGLRVGEYRIQKNWSQLRILNEILSGKPLLHKFIVKEGHSIWDVKLEWGRVWPSVTQDQLNMLLSDKQLLKKMQVPPAAQGNVKRTLEGFLFPETYSFRKYDSPRKLVEAMIDQFNTRALPILESHPLGKTPEGRYRLLTLASIVEKESGIVSEQPIIASVFWNRLTKGMKLQSDPTTIYGLMPDFNGNLTKLHLLTPSPWNTYTLRELPIGPIANPGETAIRAVVEPATTDYLFFVAKNDGSHVFSKDYKTHDAFVNEYQRKRRANKSVGQN